ncbi:MAG: phosphate ABC transporter permease PstA [Candidatus Aquicultor sp.]|nr:phosphate ABC transporter permease PstA [Candidatus Aquicultor sp.]
MINGQLIKRSRLVALGPVLCWLSAAIIVAVCAGLVLYPLIIGAKMVNLEFLLTDPIPSFNEALAGGILTPIAGTIIIILIATFVTVPIALGTAIYLSEYANRDSVITKSISLGVDVLAGVPSAVLAIFGLILFSLPQLAFLSSKVEGTELALGSSFLVGGLIMMLHIVSFVIKAMEESIRSVPENYRTAAYALGTTRWRVIRKAVLPAALPGVITGIILGIGLIAGDTAIITLCVGGSMTMTGAEQWWLPWNWLETLQGSGSTLTTFVYYSSPAGEGNAPNKAFGAAFILILIVLFLNLTVDYIMAKSKKVKAAA